MTPPKVLLFDLGGVLIDNAIFEDLPSLLPQPMAQDALFDLWLDSRAVQAFERGQIEPEPFAEALIAEWGLGLSPHDLLARVALWPRGPFPGALDLLAVLRREFVIAYLSNSNVLHWRTLAEVLTYADLALSSHELGLVKPDAAVFARAIAELGVAPGEICFFDDSARNVRAARGVGMRAYQTEGFEALSRTLVELGLMRPPI